MRPATSTDEPQVDSHRWYKGFGIPRLHSSPVACSAYRCVLVVALLCVLAIHAATFVAQMERRAAPFDPRYSGTNLLPVWKTALFHFAFLTTWSAIGVECYLVLAIILTFNVDSRGLRRVTSCMLFIVTVYQACIIFSYWTGAYVYGVGLSTFPKPWQDAVSNFGMHAGIGGIFFFVTVPTGIPVYLVDIITVYIVALAYLGLHLIFFYTIAQIYGPLDWEKEPYKAVGNLFIAFGIALVACGITLFFRWGTKSVVWRARGKPNELHPIIKCDV